MQYHHGAQQARQPRSNNCWLFPCWRHRDNSGGIHHKSTESASWLQKHLNGQCDLFFIVHKGCVSCLWHLSLFNHSNETRSNTFEKEFLSDSFSQNFYPTSNLRCKVDVQTRQLKERKFDLV